MGTIMERIVFITKIRKQRQHIKRYDYTRYYISIPKSLSDLIDQNKKYKITLEPLDER